MRDGPRRFRPDSSCPAVLRSASLDPPLPVRGCHPLWPDFPVRSGSFRSPYDASYYPARASTRPVWALPPSLAATEGIDVSFSSCRYLDVSVPCVRPGHASGGGHSARRVSPFGHARINSCLRIPAPLRSLPRPSSPPEAQASPVRSCNLLSLSESYIRFRVCLEIAVPLFLAELLVFSFFAFTSLSFPILSMIFFLCFYLVIFPNIVNDLNAALPAAAAVCRQGLESTTTSSEPQVLAGQRPSRPPKRRCSSHTFRYGYLVTT